MFSLKALLITTQSGGVIILQINLASRYYFLETGYIKKYILKNSTVSGVATKSMPPPNSAFSLDLIHNSSFDHQIICNNGESYPKHILLL